MPNSKSRFVTFSIIVMGSIAGGIPVQAKRHKHHGKAEGLDPYYKVPPIFMPAPDSRNERKGPPMVRNFGLVGLGFLLIGPNFTPKVVNIEKGSPADKTGQFKIGEMIESINGQVMRDRDPRMILGDIITHAEATDGKLRFKIQGGGEVTVTIPVLGSYGRNWPVDSPKSDKIVRNFANLLAEEKEPTWGAILFMLSTGEPQDLDVVKRWMKHPPADFGGINWSIGWEGIAYCEYYLRTGDKSILPVIKQFADTLKNNMWESSWNARGGPAPYHYGTLNASGVHCCTFLLMAKLCGVDVDNYTLNTSLKYFYRFAGHGDLNYGSSYTPFPEGGFRDNGKTSYLAETMAAAALLSPKGESSDYAKARDICAIKSFYATNWFCAAHTGGGIGEIGHHMAMNMMREKRPIQYRSYFDTRRWMLELSRRFTGAFGVAGYIDNYNASYDKAATDAKVGNHTFGNYMALTYTLCRKKLQLYGAPRSPYAKYDPDLPDRPWGDKADEAFLSLKPAPSPYLTMKDVLEETVEKDASLPVLQRLAAADVPDAVLMKYAHHPEYGLRDAAMNAIIRLGRTKLVTELMKEPDPRSRQAGLLALTGPNKGHPLSAHQVTPEMIQLTINMIKDPNESWWVTQEALHALANFGTPQQIDSLKDRVLELANAPDRPCVNYQADVVLSKIATQPQVYKTVLPKVLNSVLTLRDKGLDADLQSKLGSVNPEITELAFHTLKTNFNNVANIGRYPGGAVCKSKPTEQRKELAQIISALPNGMDFLLHRPKVTAASMRSGKESDQFVYNGAKVDPNVVGEWVKVSHELFEKYPSANPVDSVKKFYDAWQKKPRAYKMKYGFEIGDDGKAKPTGLLNRTYAGHYFVSGDMLVDIYGNEAMKMYTFTYQNRQFLIMENPLIKPEVGRSANGGAPTDDTQVSKDWNPGYIAFAKPSDDFVSFPPSRKKKKHHGRRKK